MALKGSFQGKAPPWGSPSKLEGMTGQEPGTQARLDRFGDALMRLMVRHGLASLQSRAGTGFLGLTREGKFVTSDLAFTFLPPADHRAAAQAVGVDTSELLISSGPRGPQDIERFSRDAGLLFDEHGILNLEFNRDAHLGFRNTGQAMEFVVDGVQLNVRDGMSTA